MEDNQCCFTFYNPAVPRDYRCGECPACKSHYHNLRRPKAYVWTFDKDGNRLPPPPPYSRINQARKIKNVLWHKEDINIRGQLEWWEDMIPTKHLPPKQLPRGKNRGRGGKGVGEKSAPQPQQPSVRPEATTWTSESFSDVSALPPPPPEWLVDSEPESQPPQQPLPQFDPWRDYVC
jgi:hypothetical protein